MSEYIERAAAVKIAEKYGTCNGSALGRHSGVADIIASRIDAIPAADVAPVVRCKSCKYAYRIDGPKEEYDCRKMSASAKFFQPEHFCSYGERRDT